MSRPDASASPPKGGAEKSLPRRGLGLLALLAGLTLVVWLDDRRRGTRRWLNEDRR